MSAEPFRPLGRMSGSPSRRRLAARAPLLLSFGCLLAGACLPAQASLLSGEAADTAANIVAWIAIFLVPTVLISLFWYVHILPEKVAEARNHPQTQAIHVLCLLSLIFGGLLWPVALLWAYSKPVLYKLAYGTDVAEPHAPAPAQTIVTPPQVSDAEVATSAHTPPDVPSAPQQRPPTGGAT